VGVSPKEGRSDATDAMGKTSPLMPRQRFGESGNIHSIQEEIVGVLLFIGAIWIVSVTGFFWPTLRTQLALIPREFWGLDGIVTMPFVHQGFGHLIGNTIPLLVLLMLLAGSRGRTGIIVVSIVMVNGALLWLAGGAGAHIGASGLVMGLITYLISSGLFERPLPLLISAIVAFLYGTTLIWNLLPLSPGTSWTGHLFGAIAGMMAGYVYASPRRARSIGNGEI